MTGASIGIIAFSHNSSIDKWRVGSIAVQPQVWLAIFSTIINALLGFALTKGVSIHFWKRAVHGAKVRRMIFFILPYKLSWMKLTSVRNRSCENCTMFMSRRLFWVLQKRSYRAVGMWLLSVSERHPPYHSDRKGFH